MVNQVSTVEGFFSSLAGSTLSLQYLKPGDCDPGDIAYDFDIQDPDLFPDIPGGAAGISAYYKAESLKNGEIVAPPYFTGITIHPPAGTVVAACQYRTLSGGSPYYFTGLVSDAGEQIGELKIEGKPGSGNQIAVGLVIFGRRP